MALVECRRHGKTEHEIDKLCIYTIHLMTKDEEHEIAAAMRAARAKSRGYADFFGWSTNRDLEELGVLQSFAESLKIKNSLFFNNLKSRERPNDPPDCEAINLQGLRIAFEVTELVDPDAIQAFKAGRHYDFAEWPSEKFHSRLSERLMTKDARYTSLKDTPYLGGYVIVVFTDEPALPRPIIETLLKNWEPPKLSFTSSAYLLLSYDPSIKTYPYFKLI
ncbi:MAG: hypothetical protein V9E92_01525 [Methylotenera sp.]